MLLPATAFLDLAFAAARRVSAGAIDDLTLVAPLVLGHGRDLTLQVTVAEPEEDGRRPINIYSSHHPRDSAEENWTLHASGLLGAPEQGDELTAAGAGEVDLSFAATWPPEDAEEVNTDALYQRVAEAGYNYGPLFRGLRRGYRRGNEWFGEITLNDAGHSDAHDFCLHPALSDAALHIILPALLEQDRSDATAAVPSPSRGVRLGRERPATLRVKVTIDKENTVRRLLAADEAGAPVLAMETLKMPVMDQEALGAQANTSADSL